ncbi:MAG: hypothetical protein QME51_10955 [Planctomycetota bacterium]|nr:hypothetical protein [Planctomycetota bacterium]
MNRWLIPTKTVYPDEGRVGITARSSRSLSRTGRGFTRAVKLCLVILLIGVMALSFGGKGCFLQKDESGSSVVIPLPPAIVELYELIMDTGWWKALSANYQHEGGLEHRSKGTALSANYQND